MIIADVQPMPDPVAQYVLWWLMWTWPFLLAGAIFWGVMFLKLMAMRDDAFPGRNDKILWFVAMLALNVFGALLFAFRCRSVDGAAPPARGLTDPAGPKGES